MKRLLQVCFIAAMVFGLASCNKEDDNANSGGNGGIETPTSLVGTTWGYNDGEAEVRVMFETTIVKVSVQTPHAPEYYEGTYTYSNGSGTIALVVSDTMNISFTVSGNKMTAYGTPAGDVVLTLISSNPQPGPQPGGDLRNSLVGTAWSWSTNGGGSLEFVSDSVAVVTVNNYHDHGDTLDRSLPKAGVFHGTYTYSNGNGTLWLYIDGRMMEVHFTVSGNTLTATGTPDGDVVMTLVGGNPQPGPNPGGNLSNSVVGTSWEWMNDEVLVVVGFTSASQVIIGIMPWATEVESDFYGTYNYSNYSGAINVTIDNQTRNITFTVSQDGNSLTAQNTPVGTIVMERMTE